MDLWASVGLAAPPVPALAAGVGWGWVFHSCGKQQAEPHPRLPFNPWEPASPTNTPWVPGLEGGAAERALPCQASGGSAGFEEPTRGELRGNHETWVRKPLIWSHVIWSSHCTYPGLSFPNGTMKDELNDVEVLRPILICGRREDGGGWRRGCRC